MFLEHLTYKEKMAFFIEEVSLYPVSCEPLAKGRSDIEWLEGILAGGAKIVQLRDKVSSDRALYQKALVFRKMTREAGALFIINNRVDIALLSEADGVHLGSSDLPAEKVREVKPDLIIGVSCNSPDQVSTARERGASYYNIGPLFQTETKKNLTPFLGVGAIEEFSARSDLPFTVMGGIKRGHIREVVERGARRIAVVTAITGADDIAAETRSWIQEINEAAMGRRTAGQDG